MVWDKQDEKGEHAPEEYPAKIIGGNIPPVPLAEGKSNNPLTYSPHGKGNWGGQYSLRGNFLKDMDSLKKAIHRVVHVSKQYEIVPLLVLFLHPNISRDTLTELSVKLNQELGLNYRFKSIQNGISSVLKREDIILTYRVNGVNYYSLNSTIENKIIKEYSEIVSGVNDSREIEEITPEKLVPEAESFLMGVYKDEIIKLLTEDPSKVLTVKYEKVLAFSDKLARLVKYRTKEVMKITFAKALEKVIQELSGDLSDESSHGLKVTFTSEVTHRRLIDIDVSRDLNTLITVEAKIMALSRPLIFYPELVFVCRDCGNEIIRLQDFLVPRIGENKCSACGSKNLFIDTYKSKGKELLVFTLQDLLENLESNEQPQDFQAFTTLNTKKLLSLMGQKVKVTGIVRTKIQLESERATTSEVVLEVINVQETEQRASSRLTKEDIERILNFKEKYSEKEIIDVLIDSIAPSIYANKKDTPELWAIKKSALLALVSPKKLVNGNLRKWINILVIGDKGTGKSRILEDLKRIFHLELVTGGGSTNQVGLIGMAKYDDMTKRWVYRAGALARANGTVLLIDEFDKLKEDDYKALHNAMSVGYYIFNKADLNLEIMSRESIMAMANPLKGVISNQKSLFEQVAFSTTLLDRFDIIIGLRTYESKEVVDKIDEKIWEASQGLIKRQVDDRLLVKYITYAQKIVPTWEDTAKQKLSDFVKELRKYLKENGTFNYSHRLQMSMINISEAIAKLKLKDRVTVEDVHEAIELIKIAVKSWGEDIDFSLLSELSYEFTGEQRRMLDAVEETLEDLRNYYPNGVPRDELVSVLEKKLGSKDAVRKALTLAIKVNLITKISGESYILTRDT
ncbi:hypothetical protein APY94_06300 [Thermococcus celericrescens]|uniref:MCM C-terminal AAA(+) ATPase domain-containing protein n=1 Tax=Thermococcus celericrescens TaxID=227598 RepID=A0A100XXQ9_9EURY|nr:AAA family ATPase [Thermococcus celericrescens]KUH33344.1 hypothetical protein APY94_06300 [Thermococcus celericrescens]